jgi:hypothetical protein
MEEAFRVPSAKYNKSKQLLGDQDARKSVIKICQVSYNII